MNTKEIAAKTFEAFKSNWPVSSPTFRVSGRLVSIVAFCFNGTRTVENSQSAFCQTEAEAAEVLRELKSLAKVETSSELAYRV